VDRVDVGVAKGADAAAVARSLRTAAEATGARVSTRAQWVSAHAPHTTRTTRLGYALVLGIALLYTGISLAGTLAMATAARTRDLRSLRLTGATRAQLLRLATAETLLPTALTLRRSTPRPVANAEIPPDQSDRVGSRVRGPEVI
jgi:putative ABC transport system permease protein